MAHVRDAVLKIVWRAYLFRCSNRARHDLIQSFLKRAPDAFHEFSGIGRQRIAAPRNVLVRSCQQQCMPVHGRTAAGIDIEQRKWHAPGCGGLLIVSRFVLRRRDVADRLKQPPGVELLIRIIVANSTASTCRQGPRR